MVVMPKLSQSWPIRSVSRYVRTEIVLLHFKKPVCATHVFQDDDPPSRRLVNVSCAVGAFDVAAFRPATRTEIAGYCVLAKLRDIREKLWKSATSWLNEFHH